MSLVISATVTDVTSRAWLAVHRGGPSTPPVACLWSLDGGLDAPGWEAEGRLHERLVPLWKSHEASADPLESLGRVSIDLPIGDDTRTHVQTVEETHRRIELAGGLDAEHVPAMNGLRCRMPPGSGFDHPSSVGQGPTEKQTGGVVQTRKAEVVLARVCLGAHMGEEIEHAREDREIRLAHLSRERDLK